MKGARGVLNYLIVCIIFSVTCNAHEISQIVSKVKPSIVGIGIYAPLGRPTNQLRGTGFAIGDGTIIATNYHVVDLELDPDTREQLVVFIGSGKENAASQAEIIATDPAHDLALLKIKTRVPPLKLNTPQQLADGTDVAFTGFPIGAVLGLYPATHRGGIAAYTPVVTPSVNASEISIAMMKRLKEPYFIYQLDATAFPGNSGSPVYELDNGNVVAIINKVFVQQTKEAAITNPSGITYAIPVKYLQELVDSL
ncbi:S1 family peptidase [Paraglaciecola arctica]|uniref:Peptidase S1 and S6, chymotrypsin/Hap n=1 Tax=Paraglaciecola arctica BSs20135 TaxID=493475 RepID=K6XMV5_9ALTE|nr:serine protease [Paraglaciecola arctica]GAC21979.1 peptidase S1 and S6, chymotrypsin/Hap [Paraglaciecola arctica BSs20135]|tara:strand:- start:1318 stop:2076 length:759 start_codon:yes stop_codon:yes gene_type:complete